MIDRSRLAGSVLALVLFLSGAGAGMAVDRFSMPQGDRGWFSRRRPEIAIQRYKEELTLDAAQEAAIRPVLEQRWQETVAIVKGTLPEEEQSRARAHAQIRALLRPEQQTRFDTLVERRAARRKEMFDQLDR